MFDPSRVDCWIFDLDYTLYPPACGLFGQIDQRMGQFIANLLGCDATEARRVQKMYFHDHGTTLAGLMHYHAVDPREFLDFVHDVDMSVLAQAPRLAEQIMALPGRRLIFTNGDRPYAERVLAALGLDGCFEGMWDVIAMDYKPKPEPSAYHGLIEAFGFDPARAAFVEDSARNLPPRHSACRPCGLIARVNGATARRTMPRSTLRLTICRSGSICLPASLRSVRPRALIFGSTNHDR